MTDFDVVGFGALNVDKLFKVNRIARAEEESSIKSHAEYCGGSAANTVVGLSEAGLQSGLHRQSRQRQGRQPTFGRFSQRKR